jgi:hypothetical protein
MQKTKKEVKITRARRYLHLRVVSTELNLQFFINTQQWYLTMGDGDLEMSF